MVTVVRPDGNSLSAADTPPPVPTPRRPAPTARISLSQWCLILCDQFDQLAEDCVAGGLYADAASPEEIATLVRELERARDRIMSARPRCV